jgi:hypothetical protein
MQRGLRRHDPGLGMNEKRPLFNVGDTVVERIPFGSVIAEQGTVTEAYELKGEYRYVVHFESGREAVFFENELVVDKSKS